MAHEDYITRSEFEEFREQMRAIHYGDEGGIGVVHNAREQAKDMVELRVEQIRMTKDLQDMKNWRLAFTSKIIGATMAGSFLGGGLVFLILKVLKIV